ncbi:hypothetical protein RXW27_002433 [Salmonella enterica]|nr:hypothetical protein [Salmonella enterica]
MMIDEQDDIEHKLRIADYYESKEKAEQYAYTVTGIKHELKTQIQNLIDDADKAVDPFDIRHIQQLLVKLEDHDGTLRNTIAHVNVVAALCGKPALLPHQLRGLNRL